MSTDLKVTDERASAIPATIVPSKDLSQIEALILIAVEKNYDMDKLERLIALKEKEEAKEAKKLFDAALAKFQLEVPEIIKNRKGYEGKYMFAEMAQIERTIKKTKSDNGFSYKFRPKLEKQEGEPGITLTFILSHIGGHSEETSVWGPIDKTGSKNGIQAHGSTVTYLERYAMLAGMGLTTAITDTDAAETRDKSNQPISPSLKQFDKLKDLVRNGTRKYTGDIEIKYILLPAQKAELEALEKQPKK